MVFLQRFINKEVTPAILPLLPLYKKIEGEKSDCANNRRITLLSIARKILARIILNRLIPTIAEENLPASQLWL